MFLSERHQFKTGGGEKAGRQQKRYALAYKLHREGENGPDGFDPILMGVGLVMLGLLKGKLLGYLKKDKNNTDYCLVYKRKKKKQIYCIKNVGIYFPFTVTKYRLHLGHRDLMHRRMQT